MRVAARVVVMGMAIGMLGAADARAPELAEGPTALANVPSRQGLGSASTLDTDQASLSTNRVVSASSAGNESTPDLWLLVGVCVGLIAYQLRRKHRLLRPHPFLPRPDL